MEIKIIHLLYFCQHIGPSDEEHEKSLPFLKVGVYVLYMYACVYVYMYMCMCYQEEKILGIILHIILCMSLFWSK